MMFECSTRRLRRVSASLHQLLGSEATATCGHRGVAVVVPAARGALRSVTKDKRSADDRLHRLMGRDDC